VFPLDLRAPCSAQFVLLLAGGMTADLQNGAGSDKHITGEIAAGMLMLRALDRSYTQLLETAKREWERKYTGPEPSDTCMSVRISSGDASPKKWHRLPADGLAKNMGRMPMPRCSSST